MGALVFDLQTKNPNYPSLDTATPELVGRYLSARNFLGSDETVLRIAPVGTCARNRILRIVTSTRTFVAKQFCAWPAQARPAPTPEERFRAETQFYRSARIADCTRTVLPQVLHQDAQTGCILIEDAGEAAPLAGRPITPDTAEKLGWFLVSLHHRSRSVPVCAHYRNEQVLAWQMARLFASPQHGGPAARGRAPWLGRWRDHGAGVRYVLEDALAALERGGSSLVHGDYTPANWVQNGRGLHVVDAEFSFFGPPEYDVGAYLAGLLLDRQAAEVLRAALGVIAQSCFRYDQRLVAAFAGVHLCAGLERGTHALKGVSAAAALRRLHRAVEQGALDALGARQSA